MCSDITEEVHLCCPGLIKLMTTFWNRCVVFHTIFHTVFQELLSLAKRKRSDSEEKEAPVSKPTASSDSETSDSDDEVSLSCYLWCYYGLCLWLCLNSESVYHTVYFTCWLHKVGLAGSGTHQGQRKRTQKYFFSFNQYALNCDCIQSSPNVCRNVIGDCLFNPMFIWSGDLPAGAFPVWCFWLR